MWWLKINHHLLTVKENKKGEKILNVGRKRDPPDSLKCFHLPPMRHTMVLYVITHMERCPRHMLNVTGESKTCLSSCQSQIGLQVSVHLIYMILTCSGWLCFVPLLPTLFWALAMGQTLCWVVGQIWPPLQSLPLADGTVPQAISLQLGNFYRLKARVKGRPDQGRSIPAAGERAQSTGPGGHAAGTSSSALCRGRWLQSW